MFGEGEYEIIDDYKKLEVPHSAWIRMTPDQQKQVKAFQDAKLGNNFQVSVSQSVQTTDQSSSSKQLSISWDKPHVHGERLKDVGES